MKEFHLGDILTVTHDRLMSPQGITGAYNILNHMTGESLFTHQLPRVAREANPVLRAALPFLADIDLSDVTPDNWRERLGELALKHGEMHPVPTMTEGQHERIDPLSEAAEHFRPDDIIVVSD